MSRKLRPLLGLTLFALASPLLAHETEEQKVLPLDGMPGDQFGRSVSVHEGLLVVGAPGAHLGLIQTGAAYVFHHDGAEFHQEARLVPSDGGAGDQFGFSVVASHHHVLVGAPGHDGGAGAVYVFEEVAVGVWAEGAKLQATIPVTNEGFGSSLAAHDETALIGAPYPGGVGSAYVFHEELGVWSQEQKLQASDGATGHLFGTSVGMLGDRAVVGAVQAEGRVANTGAAYVFELGTEWTEVTKLFDPNGNAADFFGNSVAIGGNTLLVGAPGDDDGGASSGTVFDYKAKPGSPVAPRVRRVGLAGDALGASVAQSYHVTIGGSRLSDDFASNSGTAKIWAKYGYKTGYQIYVASDAENDDFLGSSVATDACFVIAGAIGDDENGPDSGAVYAYVTAHPEATLENGTGVNPTCMTTIEGPQIGHHWVVTVDTDAVPGAAWSQLLVVYFLNPTPQLTSFGEILINRSSPVIANSVLPAGGVVEHEFLLPDDPYLIGADFAAQAVLRDSNFVPIGLCNAESLRMGCHEEGHGHTN